MEERRRQPYGMPYVPIPHHSHDIVAIERNIHAVTQNQATPPDERMGLETAAEILGRKANWHRGRKNLNEEGSDNLAIRVSQSSLLVPRFSLSHFSPSPLVGYGIHPCCFGDE
jgi:hypothetical protein